MYLSAVYTLADLPVDWKGIGAGNADVTKEPVDVVNKGDSDPHAVADMVIARGNVIDAVLAALIHRLGCLAVVLSLPALRWATGVWKAAHLRAGAMPSLSAS